MGLKIDWKVKGEQKECYMRFRSITVNREKSYLSFGARGMSYFGPKDKEPKYRVIAIYNVMPDKNSKETEIISEGVITIDKDEDINENIFVFAYNEAKNKHFKNAKDEV